jgi:hypothetical protein
MEMCCSSSSSLQNIPVANAKPDDIKDLLGGALFQALYKWMTESGPVYLLPTGPISSFLVISDPAAAKHVLRSTGEPGTRPAGPMQRRGDKFLLEWARGAR